MSWRRFFFLLFSLACSLIPLAYQPVISLHSSEIHRPKVSEMENSTEFTSCFLISRFWLKTNKPQQQKTSRQTNPSTGCYSVFLHFGVCSQARGKVEKYVWLCPACLDKLLPSSPLTVVNCHVNATECLRSIGTAVIFPSGRLRVSWEWSGNS